jgi:hypothetical protein
LWGSAFKSSKVELIWRKRYPTRRQAEASIVRYINEFYNADSRQSHLSAINPLAFAVKVA